jgi:hypothetical protein
MLAAWWEFLVTKRENARPAQPLPLVKPIWRACPRAGHDGLARPLLLVSAAGGKRILIDPVFSNYAAPFSFINKAFAGDYPWRAEGMPEIDLLIISHDHYDHLDYATIKALMPKIKRGDAAGRRVASALLGNGERDHQRSGLESVGAGQR